MSPQPPGNAISDVSPYLLHALEVHQWGLPQGSIRRADTAQEPRHCEERSDEAIQVLQLRPWIASAASAASQ